MVNFGRNIWSVFAEINMTMYYYLKYNKPQLFRQIKNELLVIDLYEKYYVHNAGKQDNSIELVQKKLSELGVSLDIEGIRNILKKYRKEKLKKKL